MSYVVRSVSFHVRNIASTTKPMRALEQRFSKLGSAEPVVPRNENAQWRESFIGGPNFVCTNYNSCGDIRH
jgi:hypothetical protein